MLDKMEVSIRQDNVVVVSDKAVPKLMSLPEDLVTNHETARRARIVYIAFKKIGTTNMSSDSLLKMMDWVLCKNNSLDWTPFGVRQKIEEIL